jgi:hypothetical protein
MMGLLYPWVVERAVCRFGGILNDKEIHLDIKKTRLFILFNSPRYCNIVSGIYGAQKSEKWKKGTVKNNTVGQGGQPPRSLDH